MTDKFSDAIRRIDEENSRDPNLENGHPRELLYARRLSDRVNRLSPHASEPLRLAARCQHICRWQIPRDQYPMDRFGYLKWRADLKRFHAEKSGEILRSAGYDGDTIRRVQDLNLKKNFAADPEACVLEDALCLVFLEFQLAAFADRSEDEKVVGVLRKTWAKMSESARDEALKLSFSPREKNLISRALQISP